MLVPSKAIDGRMGQRPPFIMGSIVRQSRTCERRDAFAPASRTISTRRAEKNGWTSTTCIKRICFHTYYTLTIGNTRWRLSKRQISKTCRNMNRHNVRRVYRIRGLWRDAFATMASNRKRDGDDAFENINDALARRYNLQPLVFEHDSMRLRVPGVRWG